MPYSHNALETVVQYALALSPAETFPPLYGFRTRITSNVFFPEAAFFESVADLDLIDEMFDQYAALGSRISWIYSEPGLSQQSRASIEAELRNVTIKLIDTAAVSPTSSHPIAAFAYNSTQLLVGHMYSQLPT